jgi:large-conductance mechanosensitive channel
MNYISAIIQFMIALPKVFEIFKGLWDLYEKSKRDAEEKKRLESIEELKKAQTAEEVRRANQSITRNLP